MTNLDCIIKNLQELKETNEEIRKSGMQEEYEDGVIFQGEYDQDLTDGIGCPHYDGDCLAEKKGLKYGSYAWEDACSACKTLWLLKEIE